MCFPGAGSHAARSSLQHWPVFKEVTEVFILVPALLGLKGNLEMTLASRLSTAVRHAPLTDKSAVYSGRRSRLLSRALICARAPRRITQDPEAAASKALLVEDILQDVLLQNCSSYLWLCQIRELISLPDGSCEKQSFLRSEVIVPTVT